MRAEQMRTKKAEKKKAAKKAEKDQEKKMTETTARTDTELELQLKSALHNSAKLENKRTRNQEVAEILHELECE